MAMCPINSYRNHQAGLTLIEVLVALAIISIAITAIIKATSQNIRSTAYLQTKSAATWVALQAINEARLGLIKFSDDAVLKEKTTMLEKDWYWRGHEEQSQNKRIKKISVSVYSEAIENNTASPIVTLESYYYVKPTKK